MGGLCEEEENILYAGKVSNLVLDRAETTLAGACFAATRENPQIEVLTNEILIDERIFAELAGHKDSSSCLFVPGFVLPQFYGSLRFFFCNFRLQRFKKKHPGKSRATSMIGFSCLFRF
jgi:hypothetical protein